MILALEKGSKGDKGVPIPYADARAAPWYDADEWGKHDPQGETKAPSTHLLEQYGTVAADFGFDRVSGDLTAAAAWRAAEKAAKMKIRAASCGVAKEDKSECPLSGQNLATMAQILLQSVGGCLPCAK